MPPAQRLTAARHPGRALRSQAAGMMNVVYDAGALVAAERNDRRLWADHRVRLEAGVVPVVPAPVVAQVSRSPRQAQLRRLLRGCDVPALDEATAHAVAWPAPGPFGYQ